MKEYIIAKDADGQRLDRYLSKRFPNAGKAFLQKMLRKKNIVLNDHKADGSVILKENDRISIWFSDETIAKFSGSRKTSVSIPKVYADIFEHPVFSDENILVLNKPAGLLSQPASDNEKALSDFLDQVIDNPSDTFHLAPANRLDRNTSGIILIPKNYTCQKELLAAIRDRKIIKEYAALVSGTIRDAMHLDHHLEKNADNTVCITDTAQSPIARLDLTPIATHNDTTLLKVRLHTGRTHQIRAQLSHIGHPIIGDPKYGNRTLNQLYQKKHDLAFQLLHSLHYAVPQMDYDFTAPLPDYFTAVLKDSGYTKEDIDGLLA